MAGTKRKAASARLSSNNMRTKRAYPNSVSKPLSKPALKDITAFYSSLLEYVKSKISPELLSPFEVLPDRTEYPDYYETIQHPISLFEIDIKLQKHQYQSQVSIIKDFDTLCLNAQTYNSLFSPISNASVQLHSAAHTYFLISKIPAQYTQYASQVLEMETSLLYELETYKPRSKNATHLCEHFIFPPTKQNNLEILQMAKKLKMIPSNYKADVDNNDVILCTRQAEELLWKGKFMDPDTFKNSITDFLQFLQTVYGKKDGNSNTEAAKRYQSALALQRSFMARYDKNFKAIKVPVPEGYSEWSITFADTLREEQQETENENEPETDDVEEDVHQQEQETTRLRTRNGAAASTATTGRTTTRSAWKNQLDNNSSNADDTNSAELKLKTKSEPSPKTNTKTSKAGTKAKPALPNAKQAQAGKTEQVEETKDTEIKDETSGDSRTKPSLRGTRSSSRINHNTQANKRNEAADANFNNSSASVIQSTRLKTRASARLQSPDTQPIDLKTKDLERSEDGETSVNEKIRERDTRNTRSRRKLNSEESTIPSTANTKLEPTVEEPETAQELIHPLSIQSTNTSRRRHTTSSTNNPTLICDVTLASVIPTLTKYHQSKNLVPPASQLSSIQYKFPLSQNFVNRSFSLWVPYYHHTFSLNLLLHEWLNTSSYYNVELTHNKTQVAAFKKSETSPWATDMEPIVNRYEVRLVTGLNLVELVVVAQEASKEVMLPTKSRRLANKTASLTGDINNSPGRSVNGNGSSGGTKRSSFNTRYNQLLSSSSSVDAGGSYTNNGSRNSNNNRSVSSSPSSSNSRGESSAIRNIRSRTQNLFDPHCSPVYVEQLSLWITMGAAPYN